MNVLVCDDDQSTRFVARRLLEQNFGCSVTECGNGVEALNLLGREHYAFMLLDVEMPTMDGVETLEEIRQASMTAELPVIILSSLRDEASLVKLLRLGITDYILKPVHNDVAVEKIGRLMRTLPTLPARAADLKSLRLAPDLPALLVDGNLDFRFFFMNQMKKYGPLTEAESGAAALAAFKRNPVPLVFIGQELGLIGEERLVSKLRAMRPNALRVVKLIDTIDDPALVERLYNGSAPRAFLPDTLRTGLRPYVSIGGPLNRLISLVPELPDMLTSAARQVFGMMFDSQIAYAEASTAARQSAFVATIEIILNERFVISVGIHLSRMAGLAVTAKMFGCPSDELTDEDCLSTAGELSNLLVGRIHANLRERSLNSVCALPVIDTGGVVAPIDETVGLLQSFALPDADEFHITLVVRDRLEAITSAGGAATAATAAA